MMRNIYGNNSSPLRGEGVGGRRNPTLCIGLISDVPAARAMILAVSILLLVSGCSTRVEYAPTDTPAPAQNAININTASADELEKLPGVGRKTAETIVQFRHENGPFRRSEHLMQIRGISEKRFLDIRPYIKIE